MIGEVIAIGDELTTGQRLDTNSQWLSQRLTEIGVRVLYHTTVADDLDANVIVFRAAIERADFVVATGGLGPTADDLTRDAIAAAVRVELVQDDAALADICKIFESRGRVMPQKNVVQALFPHGSLPITNANGTAPGIAMEVLRPVGGADAGACRLFALPGVPAEMHAMWESEVCPAILAVQHQRRVIRHRRIHCFGAGESHVEEMLGDLIRRGREPLVGITASSATITLRITSTGNSEAECFRAMEPIAACIRQKLGILVFGEEDDELQHVVLRLLHDRQMTMACVESSTGSLIRDWMTNVPGARKNFLDGRTKNISVYDAETAAAAVRVETNVDFGLAVSSVYHGDDEQNDSVVKVALASNDRVRATKYSLFGDAEFARIRVAKLALNMLRLALLHCE